MKTASLGGLAVPYEGFMPPGVHPLDYGTPIMSYTNIPFEESVRIFSGREYSRRLSSDYTRSDCNFGYFFRFMENPEEVSEFRKLLRPRERVLDFGQAENEEFLEILFDPFSLPKRADLFSPIDFLTDDTPDTPGNSDPVVLVE